MAEYKTRTKKNKKTKSKKETPKKKDKQTISPLAAYLLWLLTAFLLIICAFKLGMVGEFLYHIFYFLFGKAMYAFFLMYIPIAIYTLKNKHFPKFSSIRIGHIMFISGCYLWYSSPSDHHLVGMAAIKAYKDLNGGIIGSLFYGILSQLLAHTGFFIAAIFLIIGGLVLLTYHMYINHDFTAFYDIFTESDEDDSETDDNEDEEEEKPEIVEKTETPPMQKTKMQFLDLYSDSDEEDDVIEPIVPLSKKEKKKAEQKVKKEDNQDKEKVLQSIIDNTEPIRQDFSDYKFPPLSILNEPKNENENDVNQSLAEKNKIKLANVLDQFDVKGEIKGYHIGPSVIQYEFELNPGIRVNKVSSLTDDIRLALATKDVRIEAPIPGKSLIGIEIPNTKSTTVTFREVMDDLSKKNDDNKLLIPLGKDIMGNIQYMELNKMPHLLIAGATGSGKSVCINTIICTILMRTRPDEVKLLLVDPKKVELTNYDGIAHLLRPVVTDPKKASLALRTIVEEMEIRYDLFTKYGVRNIARYNELIKEKKEEDPELQDDIKPLIVVVLDEVADLMLVASKDVEDCIQRLAQMARAAGIYMIVATQRPSTDVITGVVKANIPSRIAFAVSSSVDSRTILDSAGAERLLGRGDMLFSPMDANSPVRIQGAFVSDEEVNRIVDFVKNQKESEYEEKYVNLETKSDFDIDQDEDDEYEECRDFVIRTGKASTSLLQRQFHIGYNKAARIMDQLEANEVVGPQIGSKPREVLIRGYNEEDLY